MASVATTSHRSSKPGHQRGLSIFQDMSAVDTIIGDENLGGGNGSSGSGGDDPAVQQQQREIRAPGSQDSMDGVGAQSVSSSSKGGGGGHHHHHHQRGLSLFTDENVANSIIENSGDVNEDLRMY